MTYYELDCETSGDLHLLAVIFVATDEAAAQQRQKNHQQECHQRSRSYYSHPLIRIWEKDRQKESVKFPI